MDKYNFISMKVRGRTKDRLRWKRHADRLGMNFSDWAARAFERAFVAESDLSKKQSDRETIITIPAEVMEPVEASQS